ncbi:Methionyl-tRNA formyltransferase [Legionella massiliensis]|uniref:Methionyl-tRNA formyltransferase n=1 Tax=Legionella massiliensis TaxID=1034943 RepID=A0A078L318_9GAMM|nr:formyltransferase family protein [Legionella massiliensis]CDZ78383.1 Methionyl-tRNA formyltransferase [Legionella massiliensis]CEE14121.1 Methionyl-tRNA formyltransferase [Legionella massiliensis]
MNILFLIGSDLYSYNMANEICLNFAKHPFKASFLVFKNEMAFNPEKIQEEVKRLIFYERTLFSEILLQFLKNHPNEGKYLGVDALAQKYACNYAFCPSIDNKKASQFISEQAKDWAIDVVISIRCIIKLDAPLIHYFTREKENYLWNVHPGLLPQYRGIMPIFGAMFNQEKHYGISLLRVSEKLDEGTIIDSRTCTLDYSKSMIENALDLIPAGVELITDNLRKISRKEQLSVLTQNATEKGFYSFPTAEELALFKSKGLSLYSKEGLINLMSRCYLTDKQNDIVEKLRLYGSL